MTQRHRRSLPWAMALTLARLLLLPVFVGLLIWPAASRMGRSYSAGIDRYRWLGCAVFLVMSLTDALDGYLARRLHQTSRLGAFLDPLADKILLTVSLLLLAIPSLLPGTVKIPWPVVAGAYLKDLGLVVGAMVIFHQCGSVKIRARLPGKLSTAVELLLVFFTLISPELLSYSPTMTAWVLWMLWWGTILTAAATGMEYSYQAALQLRDREKEGCGVSHPSL